MKKFTIGVCVALLCLGGVAQVSAGILDLAFTEDHLYCVAGESVTFYGTITNNTSSVLSLAGHSNSSSVLFAAMGGHAEMVPPGSSMHVPFTMSAGEVWAGPLLYVTTTTGVLPDTYGAARDLTTFYRDVDYYGGDPSQVYRSKKPWVLTVTAPAPAVPEPSAILLALGGLGALIGLRRRR